MSSVSSSTKVGYPCTAGRFPTSKDYLRGNTHEPSRPRMWASRSCSSTCRGTATSSCSNSGARLPARRTNSRGKELPSTNYVPSNPLWLQTDGSDKSIFNVAHSGNSLKVYLNLFRSSANTSTSCSWCWLCSCWQRHLLLLACPWSSLTYTSCYSDGCCNIRHRAAHRFTYYQFR